MASSGRTQDQAVVGHDGQRYYTAAQVAILLGLGKSAVDARSQKGDYQRVTDPTLLGRVPKGPGARPRYLVAAERVDAERSEMLERLGAVEAGGVLVEYDRAQSAAQQRLAELELAYAAALGVQELALVDQKALEQQQLTVEQERLRIEREQLQGLLDQLRQFYVPSDIPS